MDTPTVLPLRPVYESSAWIPPPIRIYEPTGRLGVLPPDPEAIVMPQPSMTLDLLQPLQIITELGIDTVREDLGVLPIDDITLAIKKPDRDLVLSRVLDNGDDPLEFFGRELASALVEVDVCLLAD